MHVVSAVPKCATASVSIACMPDCAQYSPFHLSPANIERLCLSRRQSDTAALGAQPPKKRKRLRIKPDQPSSQRVVFDDMDVEPLVLDAHAQVRGTCEQICVLTSHALCRHMPSVLSMKRAPCAFHFTKADAMQTTSACPAWTCMHSHNITHTSRHLSHALYSSELLSQ